MNTSLTDAANKLYKTVKIPAGHFNVIPLNDSEGKHLIVWIEKGYLKASEIPKVYLGYPVTVKEKPLASAQVS